jgi:glycosyltransferase involved in cell wall biosynthesis
MPLSGLPKPDVVVVSSLSLLTVLNGLRLRRRFRCRLVLEVRDIWPLTLTAEGGFSVYNPLVRVLAAIERLGYRHADAIVGTMPNLGAHVQEVLGEPRPVHCVPMGVPDESLDPPLPLPEGFELTYLPSDKCIVAHVGSIGISNALETLLQCAERLSEDTRLHFLLVGAGDLADSFAKRFGSLPNLTLVPRVDSAVVAAILQRCDIAYFATHPSKVWAFGQSLNKLIDYMAAGKPVVGSYSGFPSMINESNCGEFVPAGDPVALAESLQRLASLGSGVRVSMGARGREWLLAHRRYSDLATTYRQILIGP